MAIGWNGWNIQKKCGWKIIGGLVLDEEMPKDDALEKNVVPFKYGDFAQLHTDRFLLSYPTISNVKGYNPMTLSMYS